MDTQAEARGPGGEQDGAGLLLVEGARLAEHVGPADVARHGVELGAHEFGEVVLGGDAGGHDVGAEPADLVGELGGQPRRAEFLGHGQPVTGLRLQRRGALRERLGDVPAQSRAQLVVGGGAGRGDGRGDTARRVGLPGHPGLELARAVAGEDEVGVGVDPAGQDGAAAEVDALVGGGSPVGRTGPGDPAVLDDEGGVGDPGEQVLPPTSGSFVVSSPIPV